MADVLTVPEVQPVQPAFRYLRVIPGVLLLFAIGYAGKLLEQNVGGYAKSHHWTFPNIEYVLWAIVLGLLISNTAGVPEIFRSGVATYDLLESATESSEHLAEWRAHNNGDLDRRIVALAT